MYWKFGEHILSLAFKKKKKNSDPGEHFSTHLSGEIPIYSFVLEYVPIIDSVEDNKRSQVLYVAPTILCCHCSPVWGPLIHQLSLLRLGARPQDSSERGHTPSSWAPAVPATICADREWPLYHQLFASVGIHVHLCRPLVLKRGRGIIDKLKKKRQSFLFL